MGARYPLVFLILLLLHGANAHPQAPEWLTLNGRRPLVIAHGGFSGVFPGSSQLAFSRAVSYSLPDVVLFCDLQFSSDGVGFCVSTFNIENSTMIGKGNDFASRPTTYKVNGKDIQGWFSLDFKSEELHHVPLIQNTQARSQIFDGLQYMLSLDNVVKIVQPQEIWVNVQYDSFFREHGLCSEDYILGMPKEFPVTWVSSPEVSLLKRLAAKISNNTKLIFRFLPEDLVEPTTKITYGELLKDLKSIKAFASGILVPKQFIWPLNKDLYLDPATSLVKDAHALGLEVYASGFSNDESCISHNYSYDPSLEYLQFIDNSDFSVDGVLTGYPPTASATIACLAHTKCNALSPPGIDTAGGGRPLIITHNGASGVFSDSTDLAYQQAVKDGADIIDCWVRMSKDGVAFCQGSLDLNGSTTAATSFGGKMTIVNEIQNKSGIFSFDLSWNEIQTLKPNLIGPFSESNLNRNPAAKNCGKFMTLAGFLDYAKASNISGILIGIEHAAYLETRGLDVVAAVSNALIKSGYDKETKQHVLIQSEDPPVLSAFMKFPKFKRVFEIEFDIGGVSQPSVFKIKEFANAVKLRRSSAARVDGFYLSGFTDALVDRLHNANIEVYVGILKNEYMNLAFDYWADPMVEIVTDTWSVLADGLVTEFPATAAAYFRSPCSDPEKNELTYTIRPAIPGGLLNLASFGMLPPAPPPAPMLEPSDVHRQPLPLCPTEPMFRTFRCRLAPGAKLAADG